MKFKDGSSEAAHMADPQYGHLHEDFHVLVEYEGNADGRNSAFRVADSLIRTVLSGGTIQVSGGIFVHMRVDRVAWYASTRHAHNMLPCVYMAESMRRKNISVQV